MGIRWLKMGKMSDKMRQDGATMRKMKDVSSVLAPSGREDLQGTTSKMTPGGAKRVPRWPQKGPRGPQDGPKRPEDEASIAQHGPS